MITDFRSAFADRFGEENARRVEDAAEQHRGDSPFVHERGRGGDPCRWAILVAISFECLQRFASGHGFTCNGDEVFAWLKEPDRREWLAAHDGDFDALALIAGVYNQLMPEKTEAAS